MALLPKALWFGDRARGRKTPKYSDITIMLTNKTICKPRKHAQKRENYRKLEESIQLIVINETTNNSLTPSGVFVGTNSPSLQGGFYTNKSPLDLEGFNTNNSGGGDGRSPQSKQGARVTLTPAETIGRRIDSAFMKNNFDGNQPSKPIITQKGCPSCGSNIGVIGEGTPPHHAALRCGCCNKFLRWMPKPKGAIRQNDSTQLNNMGGR